MSPDFSSHCSNVSMHMMVKCPNCSALDGKESILQYIWQKSAPNALTMVVKSSDFSAQVGEEP